ncbi:hypothetical protein PVAP13_3KG110427 [Panicum virgatum]|uniref:Endonuclease/exonuclease/phosphatase domain-containing protein n=1 Tax=Panicum virgatum TaxID=38727 RepID=A0A8T0UPY9_PANVG|nr:hypothetical protein PVAP13_3KG110427 [Panicum virgatum]
MSVLAPCKSCVFVISIMSEQKCLLLNWNVRGLNNKARRKVVKDLVQDKRCTIAALQETKLAMITADDISETLGIRFSKHFAYLPAQGTRGGALVAVDEDFYSITHLEFREHTVSVFITSTQSLATWWLTVVYGPQGDREKIEFLHELRDIKAVAGDNWLVIGDFNLILQAEDKSNDNLNRRLMTEFRNTLNFLELKELPLKGRKYTWSNDTTQTRIDRAFCTVEWDLMLPASMLEALSSLVSDHSPLFLVGASAVSNYRGFRFETFWPQLPGYQEVVQ